METAPRQPKIGVKAIILRDQHLLTVVKAYPEGKAYILPGGSQEHGETLDAAIARECLEEIGTTITVERLLCVREYIGANHQHASLDMQLHIVDIMFACTLPDDYVPQLGRAPDDDQIGVQWLLVERLHEYRFYPAALQAWLVQPEMPSSYIGDIN